MTAAVYGTSAIKRNRRSKVELEVLEAAIYEVAAAERPCTIRGVFYRVMSKGLVPKSEQGYRVVQNRILLMRRSGALPYNWISDGTRWRIKPETFSSLDKALRDTATFYRRALWDDQDVHIEIWSEKDAITSVVQSVTSEFDVPLMVARGFASESFLWQTAQAIIDDGKPAVIYQLGDHDPSGVAAWGTLGVGWPSSRPTRRSNSSGWRSRRSRSRNTSFRRGRPSSPIRALRVSWVSPSRSTPCRRRCSGRSSGRRSSSGSTRRRCASLGPWRHPSEVIHRIANGWGNDE